MRSSRIRSPEFRSLLCKQGEHKPSSWPSRTVPQTRATQDETVSDGTRCTGGVAGRRCPDPRAPAQIPLPCSPQCAGRRFPAARLGSSSSGPRRRTASPAGQAREHRPAAAPAGPAPRRHSRTSALRVLKRGTERVVRGRQSAHAQGRGGRGARHGWGPLRAACSPPVPARPGEPSPHFFQQFRRWPVVLLWLRPVRRRRLGLTVARRRRELRSLEALRPALAHCEVRCGGGGGWEDRERRGTRRGRRVLQPRGLLATAQAGPDDGPRPHGEALRVRIASLRRGRGQP